MEMYCRITTRLNPLWINLREKNIQPLDILLKEDIRICGMQTPLLVEFRDGDFTVIRGNARLQAAWSLKLERIPVEIVMSMESKPIPLPSWM